MLIDTHAHLTDSRFDADREAVLERARKAGVDSIIEVACSPDDWEKALRLAQRFPQVRCVLGIHPQEAKQATEALFERLEELCTNPCVAGIGETGFDYHYEYSPRDVQKDVFLRHVALARRLVKPIVVHCREAYPDLIALLKGMNAAPFPGVVHCFSGSPEEMRALLDLGFFIGLDGPLTFPGSGMLRECVAELPIERLLLETDSPYLAPQAYRGKRNEPAYVRLTAEEAARVKNVSFETLAEAASANARRLFGLTQ